MGHLALGMDSTSPPRLAGDFFARLVESTKPDNTKSRAGRIDCEEG